MPVKASPPPDYQENPVIPPGMQPLVFEQFAGINTAATRPGIKDEEMWWADGFMPLGPQFLRTLYGVAAALWTAPANTSIVWYDFGNIASTPYAIVVLSDGSIQAVNTDTGSGTQIAAASTITTPVIGQLGMTQWGSTYIIIVAKQTNGYFIWDGTLLYKAGALAPGVTVTAGGSGYSSGATAAASGGSGSGATFTVQTSGGVVTGITMTNPGSGYAATNTVSIVITAVSGGSGATATVALMPYAVGGNDVETYTGRVWVANGPVITYSSPGAVGDFSAGTGGGNFTSTDSYLRVGYTKLLATNGFLYLIGDSSINYISGVSTSGSFVTTFTNQNADPEVGTIWPDTVDVFGRNIVFANSFGAHISYGAAVTKISEPLDGVFNTVPLADFGSFVPSAAKANIFGKKVWMFLLPIIDPITNVQTNKLFMWNGKLWWAATQDIPLQFIQHQEINSVLSAWGTNGSSLYQLFQQPTVATRKVVQSKLWAAGGIFLGKASGRLWVMAQYYQVDSPNLVISIDNEFGIDTQTYTLNPTGVVWHTQGGSVANWVTQGSSTVTWFIAGVNVYDAQPVGQQGVLLGITTSTFCNDMALISEIIDSEIVQYRG